MLRRRLDLDADPLDVLRRCRGRDRLVALLGAWHHGEALIAFDPTQVADDPFDLPLPGVAAEPDAFGGGWIGVWGHQLGRRVERLPEPGAVPVPQPTHRLAFYPTVLRRTGGQWWLEQLPGLPDAQERREAMLAVLDEPGHARTYELGAFRAEPGPEAHKANVARAREHLLAGDIFQVNLTTRLDASFAGEPLDLFCAGVERLSPAYGAFVGWPDGAVASFSPELFLRRTGHEVLTSPIKGTAPLDSDVGELVASAKNRAENVMIVDLMRNDLGRLAVPGTVRVPSLVRAERHAVWHLVSDVVAHLPAGVDDGALLRATFPPGSVTGAPKVRAMEILTTLEPTAREAYTGAIGHVSPHAGLEANVVIRTIEVAKGHAWLGVGGGVVVGSTPEGEWAECLVKARPVVEAVGGVLPYSADLDDVVTAPVSVPPTPDVDLAQGVYDTVLVVDGEPVELEAHLARLDASVRALWGTTIRPGLERAARRRAAGLRGRHRLRLDAGPAGDDVAVTMETSPVAPVASWSLDVRTVPGGLGEHKWADRSRVAGERDVLVLDADGSVLETGRANVFLVLDDGVHTPALDGRVLPGTVRARVVERLLAAGVPVHQRRVHVDELAAAHEVFATNALRGVVPVAEVDGIGRWTPGRTAALAADLLRGAPLPTTEPSAVPGRPRVLLVDNYDSFVFNLAQYVQELGASAEVVRHDEVSVEQLEALHRDGGLTHLVVSPGPGAPRDAGISNDAIRRLGPLVPTLGVCLGHQCIGEVFGAAVVRAPEVVHGRPSLVHHDGRGVLAGLPDPLVCARYHSLVVDEATLPPELEATAHTAGGVLMGLRHRTLPIEGVQMHPESILTRHGHDLLATFLRGSAGARQ